MKWLYNVIKSDSLLWFTKYKVPLPLLLLFLLPPPPFPLRRPSKEDTTSLPGLFPWSWEVEGDIYRRVAMSNPFVYRCRRHTSGRKLSLSFFCMKSCVAVATRLIFLELQWTQVFDFTDFTREYNFKIGKNVQKGQCRCLFVFFSYPCRILAARSIRFSLIRNSRDAGVAFTSSLIQARWFAHSISPPVEWKGNVC